MDAGQLSLEATNLHASACVPPFKAPDKQAEACSTFTSPSPGSAVRWRWFACRNGLLKLGKGQEPRQHRRPLSLPQRGRQLSSREINQGQSKSRCVWPSNRFRHKPTTTAAGRKASPTAEVWPVSRPKSSSNRRSVTLVTMLGRIQQEKCDVSDYLGSYPTRKV